ncbi:hypothetical protein ZWY2020_001914 [Hordeum vulgare]|nr:hypothetical protein ZWY2020_001914 [Hordeum vulgare]
MGGRRDPCRLSTKELRPVHVARRVNLISAAQMDEGEWQWGKAPYDRQHPAPVMSGILAFLFSVIHAILSRLTSDAVCGDSCFPGCKSTASGRRLAGVRCRGNRGRRRGGAEGDDPCWRQSVGRRRSGARGVRVGWCPYDRSSDRRSRSGIRRRSVSTLAWPASGGRPHRSGCRARIRGAAFEASPCLGILPSTRHRQARTADRLHHRVGIAGQQTRSDPRRDGANPCVGSVMGSTHPSLPPSRRTSSRRGGGETDPAQICNLRHHQSRAGSA